MSEIFRPSDKLLALSWKQPFAELMLHGKIETRTWSTKYRGWVLICASKSGYNFNQVHNIAGDRQIVRITEKLRRNFSPFVSHRRAGVAIAVGKLVDCRPMKEEDEDRCFVQFHPDLYCHIYEGVTPIDPFPWKGTQGWKEVDIAIKNQIKLKEGGKA